ncbi:family 43 glycosylhydrolase [Micromonospora endolithica]|uniref:Glycosyl hydrolase n=1 Tax=Micromonospora endolithica TaxID=230091 RepID=A0A3A9ZSZ3_9ACTN|nr:family 43 glycosylhydrolase [Micromonospora endolithica]RKN50726.1 glycosyl hydrolase [Micromonospora endolithica]TWJ20534.1 GH43 family beta-xylosidase [Micromonospora endolithica]
MVFSARIRRSVVLLGLVAALVAAPAISRPAAAQLITVNNPVISQRADTAIYKHTDGYYYMTASVPDYKRVEVRRSTTLQGLGSAATSNAFVAPSSGPLSGWIWAPDIRFHDGAWYMYFSASPGEAVFNQRLYWIRNTCANPMTCSWSAPQRFDTGWDSFQLDPASFVNRGVRYFVWAQDSPSTNYNSHLYIARMNGPTGITGPTVEIARPTHGWEMEGVAGVVEGPSPLVKNGRVYIAYSASATDSRYKLGLLSSWDDADLLNTASWYKHPAPVFQTANGVYGPGHGSFTVAEDGQTDLLVYHARDYATPRPDALTDPNRHTRIQQLYWRENGDPFFGQPIANTVTNPGIRGRHSNRCVDNYEFNPTPGALVRLWDCNGNAAQQWEFTYRAGSYYEIRNRNTGTCLDDLNANTAPNADVGLYPCNGSTAQRWTIQDRGNGWFSLRNVAGDMCLDNYNWDPANGARLSLYPCNGLAAQLWRRG